MQYNDNNEKATICLHNLWVGLTCLKLSVIQFTVYISQGKYENFMFQLITLGPYFYGLYVSRE